MRTCKQCGKSIEHKHPNAKFCGQKCKDRFHNIHNPCGLYARIACEVEADQPHPYSSEALGQWED